MKKITLFLFIIVFLNLNFINAEPTLITPDEFEFLQNTSVDVMRAFRTGLEIVYKYDPVFFIDADTVQAFSKDGFSVPLRYSEQEIKPIQGDMTIYWQPFKENNWSLALIANTSTIDLQVKEKGLLPESIYGWYNRFIMIGIRATLFKFLRATVGYLRKYSPIILKDEYGKKFFYDENDGYDIKHNINDSNFFHTDIFGIDLATVLKAGQGIDLIEFKIPFDFNNGYIRLNYYMSYFRFNDILKAGFSISNEIPLRIEGTKIESIIIETENFMKVYARNDWTGLTSSIITFSVVGDRIKIPRKTLKELESFKSFKIGFSFSKELFNDGITGAFLEFGNINFSIFEWRYLSCIIGIAYNYHYYLYRMPIRNYVLIPFSLRWFI